MSELWWAVSALAGIAIGAWFKVQAIAAATLLLATAAAVCCAAGGVPLLASLGGIVLAIVCLHAGYVAGAFISTRLRR